MGARRLARTWRPCRRSDDALMSRGASVAASLVLTSIMVVQRAEAVTHGVVEGDGFLWPQVYHNGFYVSKDNSVPLLRLNGVRSLDIKGAAIPVATKTSLVAGDILAISVNASDQPDVIEMKDWLGKPESYPFAPGLIAAFDDGTMTSSEWRCSSQWFDGWFLRDFDDTNASIWQQAVEQESSCCPWRDLDRRWERLHAKWIGPVAMRDKDTEVSKVIFCRYRVPLANSSRLPLAARATENPSAPAVNVSSVAVSSSGAEVSFQVDRRAKVVCGTIAFQYMLRAPTAGELAAWGVSSEVEAEGLRWVVEGAAPTPRGYSNISALPDGFALVSGIQQCQLLCEERPECGAITYYEVGVDYATGSNCKLMRSIDPLKLDSRDSALHLMTHMTLTSGNLEHSLVVGGKLAPGYIYQVFCAAFAVGGLPLASTWEAVKETATTVRVEGCIDCGVKPPPSIHIRGGWMSDRKLHVIVSSSSVGRAFCAARKVIQNSVAEVDAMPWLPSSEDIVAAGRFVVLPYANIPGIVVLDDLSPMSLYEVVCLQEGDGGRVSDESDILATRRLWRTEATKSNVSAMAVSETIKGDDKTIIVEVGISARGYLFCAPFLVERTTRFGMPTAANITQEGRSRGELQQSARVAMVFKGLVARSSYETFCFALGPPYAEALELTRPAPPPYPMATILRGEVVIDTVRLRIAVDYGPSLLICKAFPYRRRPFEQQPQTPSRAEFTEGKRAQAVVMETYGTTVLLDLSYLAPGEWHDVFCYAEELPPPEPQSGETTSMQPTKGMTPSAIESTRTRFRTKGPPFTADGWHCVAGRPCSISAAAVVSEQPLPGAGRVMVRTDRCPGPCRCSGAEDIWHKGAVCTVVKQGPFVEPVRGDKLDPNLVDMIDPRGAWCYVDPDSCDDATLSNHTALFVSWTACSYEASVNDSAVRTVSGFPRHGVAISSSGSFSWGRTPILADGGIYRICWCGSLGEDMSSSTCSQEADFRLTAGLLHISGPSASQRRSDEVQCLAGRPCQVEHFDGHALFDGSRLAVLPAVAGSCHWSPSNSHESLYPPGFPQHGVSLPAYNDGRSYSWGNSPVVAEGGRYLLCWCGARPAEASQHRRRTGRLSEDKMAMEAYSCDGARPDGGSGFLMHAGFLLLVGPQKTFVATCPLGVECQLHNIQGYGLQGGDRLMVLRSCGQAAQAPTTWWLGRDVSFDLHTNESATHVFEDGRHPDEGMPSGWTRGGWSVWASLSEEMIAGLGFDLSPVARGSYGFPNGGVAIGVSEGSATNPDGNQYSWGGPTWALVGEYKICWCGESRGIPCTHPEHFSAEAGAILVTGPKVLPGAHQAFTAIRGKPLLISNVEGFQLKAGVQLAIVDEYTICGGEAARGVPGNGISHTSKDGSTFDWGSDALSVFPGKYRICYCANVGNCAGHKDFRSFAGILEVKGPSSNSATKWFCLIGEPCNISGVIGDGFSTGDRINVMSNCGEGTAPEGFTNQGKSIATHKVTGVTSPSWTFTLPIPKVGGQYAVCFCPAESMCASGVDFFQQLGQVVFAGPNPSALYLCYEWRPCTVSLLGAGLRNGDRVLVMPEGSSCTSHERVNGWPLEGLSLPAFAGGRSISWGMGDGLQHQIRAQAKVYALCWCSVELQLRDYKRNVGLMNISHEDPCTHRNTFVTTAGHIRIGTYKEYMYTLRPPQSHRRHDTNYGYFLAAPLPLLVCILFGACCRHRRASRVDPEAPQVSAAKWTKFDQLKERKAFAFGTEMLMILRRNVREALAKAKNQPTDISLKTYPDFTKPVSGLSWTAKRLAEEGQPSRVAREGRLPSRQPRPSSATSSAAPSNSQESNSDDHARNEMGIPEMPSAPKAPFRPAPPTSSPAALPMVEHPYQLDLENADNAEETRAIKAMMNAASKRQASMSHISPPTLDLDFGTHPMISRVLHWEEAALGRNKAELAPTLARAACNNGHQPPPPPPPPPPERKRLGVPPSPSLGPLPTAPSSEPTSPPPLPSTATPLWTRGARPAVPRSGRASTSRTERTRQWEAFQEMHVQVEVQDRGGEDIPTGTSASPSLLE